MTDQKTITIDGTSYRLDDLSSVAKDHLSALQFVDARVQQLQNEWAVADTARMAYQAALKREMSR